MLLLPQWLKCKRRWENHTHTRVLTRKHAGAVARVHTQQAPLTTNLTEIKTWLILHWLYPSGQSVLVYL